MRTPFDESKHRRGGFEDNPGKFSVKERTESVITLTPSAGQRLKDMPVLYEPGTPEFQERYERAFGISPETAPALWRLIRQRARTPVVGGTIVEREDVVQTVAVNFLEAQARYVSRGTELTGNKAHAVIHNQLKWAGPDQIWDGVPDVDLRANKELLKRAAAEGVDANSARGQQIRQEILDSWTSAERPHPRFDLVIQRRLHSSLSTLSRDETPDGVTGMRADDVLSHWDRYEALENADSDGLRDSTIFKAAEDAIDPVTGDTNTRNAEAFSLYYIAKARSAGAPEILVNQVTRRQVMNAETHFKDRAGCPHPRTRQGGRCGCVDKGVALAIEDFKTGAITDEDADFLFLPWTNRKRRLSIDEQDQVMDIIAPGDSPTSGAGTMIPDRVAAWRKILVVARGDSTASVRVRERIRGAGAA